MFCVWWFGFPLVCCFMSIFSFVMHLIVADLLAYPISVHLHGLWVKVFGVKFGVNLII